MSDLPNDTFGAAPGSDPFASAKASAMKAAEELRAAAAAKAEEFRTSAEQHAQQFRDTAGEKAAEFKDYAEKAWDGARTQAKDFTVEAEKFAREKPIQALLTAFGVGFLLGAIFKR
ncbi:MAG TPA: hypothetical protein VK956_06440 [Verrucomicrobium sp.]|nr:hypothetical protein [Verrucomicrobium sp.]